YRDWSSDVCSSDLRRRRPRSTPSVRSAENRLMLSYALRRVLLIVPTLFAIILVNFVIVQAAPGGPVDQLISQLRGTAGTGSLERVTGGGGELSATATSASQAAGQSRASRGLDPEFIAEL